MQGVERRAPGVQLDERVLQVDRRDPLERGAVQHGGLGPLDVQLQQDAILRSGVGVEQVVDGGHLDLDLADGRRMGRRGGVGVEHGEQRR